MRYLLPLIFCLSFNLSYGQKSGHNIVIKVENPTDSAAFLANYYGKKQYYTDTAYLNSKGEYIFQGEEKLQGGIYSIIFNKESYFEFLVSDQNFTLSTNKPGFVKNMKVQGSKENEKFFHYFSFLGDQQEKNKALNSKLTEAKTSTDSSLVKKEIKNIGVEINNYREKVITENPDMFVSTLFKTMQEPQIPEQPEGNNDSLFAYNFFKKHYFDNLNFADNRLVRTPLMEGKIIYYMDKLTMQVPDSIIASIDVIANLAKTDDENFRFSIITLLNKYANSKIMGMDAVYVHIAEKYYLSGDAYWIDDAEKIRFEERVRTLKPILIGEKAPKITLSDPNNQPVSLYDINKDFTILYFYDVDCSHCKKTTPVLKEFYDQRKAESIEVMAIYTQHEMDKWEKYMLDNSLNWINVVDQQYLSDFREKYDIKSTPQIYILDKDKKIILKNIGVNQLPGIFDQLIEQKKQTEEKP
jgi:peroxiredoxin